MERIKKNQILNYIGNVFREEKTVNPHRLREINNLSESEGAVVYLITREFRCYDNFALNYSLQKAAELNKVVKIIFLIPKFELKTKENFFTARFQITKQDFRVLNFHYEIFSDNSQVLEYLQNNKPALLVKDFNPIEDKFLPEDKFKIVEVDGHNILPAFFVSQKQEYNAASLRRKIYFNIDEFMSEYPLIDLLQNDLTKELKSFIKNKLPFYEEFKNNPTKEVTSGFSKYLNWGFISSQRIAIEVIKSDATDANKEAFLEELIIRKELADNFCLYNSNFKNLEGIPSWAKQTLAEHAYDLRTYLYSLQELENANTSDPLWNAAQIQLLKEGIIQGYMRMYWAKKIAEWSPSPQEALDRCIYLNDKYAFDAPSPDGYVGILWSIGGLHDRAFAQRPVTGKIRSMTYNGAKSKFDVKAYIEKHSLINTNI